MTTATLTGGNIPKQLVRAHHSDMTLAKRLGTLITAVLVMAVLGVAGIAGIALYRGTWSVTPVLSGSMRPGLSVGGVVISERVPVHSLALRDVIVFRNPNEPAMQMVHRIVRISKSNSGQFLITTQGDANAVPDPWLLKITGDYAYRVRWSAPLLGYVAVAFENHRGVALIGAGMILLLIVFATLYGQRRRGLHAIGAHTKTVKSRAQNSYDFEPRATPRGSISGPSGQLQTIGTMSSSGVQTWVSCSV